MPALCPPLFDEAEQLRRQEKGAAAPLPRVREYSAPPGLRRVNQVLKNEACPAAFLQESAEAARAQNLPVVSAGSAETCSAEHVPAPDEPVLPAAHSVRAGRLQEAYARQQVLLLLLKEIRTVTASKAG